MTGGQATRIIVERGREGQDGFASDFVRFGALMSFREATMRRLITALIAATLVLGSLGVLTANAGVVETILLGTHGTAKLTRGGPNTISVNAHGISNGFWTETLYTGTCKLLGAKIVGLPILFAFFGATKRTNTLTSAQANKTASGVILLTHGSSVICASFLPKLIGP